MAADRRTARVGLLKIALPLTALALIAAVFVFPREGLIGGLSVDRATIDLIEGLRLEQPRFTGETSDGRPFTVTADWALPDGPDPETVRLGPVTGGIAVEDGLSLTLSAGGGELRPKDETLRLDGGVALETSDGYRLTAASALADLDAGALTAEGPISGSGPLGSVESETMRAARRAEGDYIWFEGGVRVVVEPGRARPESEE
jgi:lipopolysaccharide export system protein LptC